MRTSVLLTLLLLVPLSCSDSDSGDLSLDQSPVQDPVDAELVAGAYKLSDGTSLASCLQYMSYEKGDADYWIDPDGAEEPFVVGCDMTNGGYAVFESQSTPAFPHTALTDTTVTFFSAEQIDQMNALRAQADEIEIDTDLAVKFNSDTSSGGCNGTPVIAAGTMHAVTLPLSVGDDTTETTHEFAGSADHLAVEYDNVNHIFEVTGQTPAAGGCTDALVAAFGVNDAVILKELKLATNSGAPTRAYSQVSGTYYHVRMK